MAGRKSRAGRVCLTIFLTLLCLILVGLIWFYFAYGRTILKYRANAIAIASQSSEADFKAAGTTICYFSDGTVMSTLKGEKDNYYLTYSEIPSFAIDSMIVTEDRKFYNHPGYDISAIIRAIRAYIINKGEIHQGASTITQQLARNIYLSNDVSMERKITEIFLAKELEKRYSKNEILEFYMNNIYFANGYYGIQAAAIGYFGKSVSKLSLSQIAFLCAIPNNPTIYDPVVNMENTLERRDNVLRQLYENGFIEKAEYDEALAAKIKLRMSTSEKHDYAETYTYYCAVRAIMQENGFSFRYSFDSDEDRDAYRDYYYETYYSVQRSLYTGGYRIYTSINRDMMTKLSEAIARELEFDTSTNEEGVYRLQASAVCIDNSTGLVTAIAGGREQDLPGYTLNRAFQSPRQPGSAIKPLIVYTPFFERGNYPDALVVDERFEGGPRNSSGVYSGEIDVRYAVAQSKNTVAWKLFEELTPRVGLSYLQRMRFSSIVESDFVPAASLGGLTYGATAVEMTSAYAAIENDGVYRSPTCIEMITDSAGNIITQEASQSLPVYQANASRMMTDVLTDVMETGTAKRINTFGQAVAGKTGTTNDQKDGWFVGFTRYYTTGVWVGYDYPKALDGLMGNTYPAYIWSDYMKDIHEGLPREEFTMYEDNRPKPVEEESDEATEYEDFGEDEIFGEDEDFGEDENPYVDEESEANENLEGAGSISEAQDESDEGGIIWISPTEEDGD